MFSIPKLTLGTYLMHGEQLTNAVDEALRIGYRSFDTARFYENEKELGDALEMLLPKYNLVSSDIYVITKLFPLPVGGGNSNPEIIEQQVRESLKNLGRSYIDLLLIHYPRPFENSDLDPSNPETRRIIWKKLENLKNSGIIRNLGVSNYESRHIEEIRAYSSLVPAVNQVEYHPHFQRGELRDYCRSRGIQFQAFSPLGRQNAQLLKDPEILKISEKLQKPVAWIILRWAVQNGVGVVSKSITPSRLAQNFEATVGTDFVLGPEEMRILNGLNRDSPYVEDNGWLSI